MTAEDNVPWVLEQTPMPASGSDAGVDGLPMGMAVTLENIVALARAIGFQGGSQVAAPADEAGVRTLSQDSISDDGPDPFADRTVHIDQYTGKILAQVGFADYGLAGKATAVGISLHEGQIALVPGVAVPMLGLTLLAVLLLDFVVLQNVPAMKRAFS